MTKGFKCKHCGGDTLRMMSVKLTTSIVQHPGEGEGLAQLVPDDLPGSSNQQTESFSCAKCLTSLRNEDGSYLIGLENLKRYFERNGGE